jgi:hypothetical protein
MRLKTGTAVKISVRGKYERFSIRECRTYVGGVVIRMS